eukprot:432795_1
MNVDTGDSEKDKTVALYSRQLHAIYQYESMKKLQQSTVLISLARAFSAAAFEIAKITILANVKSVTILNKRSWYKRSWSQYRINQLKSLNPYVNFNYTTDFNYISELKYYDIIVLVQHTLAECITYNRLALTLNLRFISVDTHNIRDKYLYNYIEAAIIMENEERFEVALYFYEKELQHLSDELAKSTDWGYVQRMKEEQIMIKKYLTRVNEIKIILKRINARPFPFNMHNNDELICGYCNQNTHYTMSLDIIKLLMQFCDSPMYLKRIDQYNTAVQLIYCINKYISFEVSILSKRNIVIKVRPIISRRKRIKNVVCQLYIYDANRNIIPKTTIIMFRPGCATVPILYYNKKSTEFFIEIDVLRIEYKYNNKKKNINYSKLRYCRKNHILSLFDSEDDFNLFVDNCFGSNDKKYYISTNIINKCKRIKLVKRFVKFYENIYVYIECGNRYYKELIRGHSGVISLNRFCDDNGVTKKECSNEVSILHIGNKNVQFRNSVKQYAYLNQKPEKLAKMYKNNKRKFKYNRW